MPATVAVVRCDTYDESDVFEAVGRGLELLGGAGSFVHDAERILLKPNLLVDLNRLIHPRLAVTDGVIGMEGNGPRGGDPRQVGVIMLSNDLVALDVAACRVMNLDTALVGTITYGEAWGLGNASDITYVGDDIDPFVVPDYNVNRSRQATTDSGRPKGTLAKRLVVPRPVIDSARCTACGTCVSVCPVTPKAVDWQNGKGVPPVHDYAKCIRCYCCQEMCPERAIDVQIPPFGRSLHRRSR
ncbi:MAG: DUF362 domain-containing protein [Actinomycetia bacterium]|nr:DUF362 domain-containing protein [Actinomycetes bacterium]